MSTVPIVTEVTKAQLDALVAANGLNEGLQYKVTDKDWLLIAISDSTLSPIYSIISILSGDIIPAYIIHNEVIISTGQISGDYTTQPLEIHIPAGFFIRYIKNDNNSLLPATSTRIEDIDENIYLNFDAMGLFPGTIYFLQKTVERESMYLFVDASSVGLEGIIYLYCENLHI